MQDRYVSSFLGSIDFVRWLDIHNRNNLSTIWLPPGRVKYIWNFTAMASEKAHDSDTNPSAAHHENVDSEKGGVARDPLAHAKTLDDAIGVNNQKYHHGNVVQDIQVQWTVTRILAIIALCGAYTGSDFPNL